MDCERKWGFGKVCIGLSCLASASFTDEERKGGWEVESAVVWVYGRKLVLSSEWRFTSSEKKKKKKVKSMQKESVPFSFHWNCKYVAFLLYFSFK